MKNDAMSAQNKLNQMILFRFYNHLMSLAGCAMEAVWCHLNERTAVKP